MKTSCWFLAFGLLWNACAENFRTDINPAFLYYQAFILTPDLDQADRDYLWMTNNWRSRPLPERFGKLVAQYDDQFSLVRQAAHATAPVDWGIDMSRGPATLLPILPRAKAVALAARYRAIWELEQGRPADARQDLVAGLVLGRNVSRQGTLIATLVQIAIEAITVDAIAENFGQFPPEELRQLMRDIDAAPARGTFAGCIPFEKAYFHDWTVENVLRLRKEHPGDDAAVMSGLRHLVGAQMDETAKNELWDEWVKATGGSSEKLLALLQERERFYEELPPLLKLPCTQRDKLDRFSQKAAASPNPFIKSVADMSKARARQSRMEVWMAMVHAAVAYKLDGPAGLASVADPCGTGPFVLERFVFQGVDRGFSLRSAYEGSGFPEVLIFVEKQGTPFRVDGPKVGHGYAEETR